MIFSIRIVLKALSDIGKKFCCGSESELWRDISEMSVNRRRLAESDKSRRLLVKRTPLGRLLEGDLTAAVSDSPTTLSNTGWLDQNEAKMRNVKSNKWRVCVVLAAPSR